MVATGTLEGANKEDTKGAESVLSMEPVEVDRPGVTKPESIPLITAGSNGRSPCCNARFLLHGVVRGAKTTHRRSPIRGQYGLGDWNGLEPKRIQLSHHPCQEFLSSAFLDVLF
jgi:hypothetical protein